MEEAAWGSSFPLMAFGSMNSTLQCSPSSQRETLSMTSKRNIFQALSLRFEAKMRMVWSLSSGSAPCSYLFRAVTDSYSIPLLYSLALISSMRYSACVYMESVYCSGSSTSENRGTAPGLHIRAGSLVSKGGGIQNSDCGVASSLRSWTTRGEGLLYVELTVLHE